MGETEGKLGLVLMGRAMLSKSLIQFSIDGWSCVPSLLFTPAAARGWSSEWWGGDTPHPRSGETPALLWSSRE